MDQSGGRGMRMKYCKSAVRHVSIVWYKHGHGEQIAQTLSRV